MEKVYRIHLKSLTGRVVRMRQLTTSQIQELQINGARAAGESDKVTFQEMAIREVAEGMRQSVHSVTRHPVQVWRPTEKPPAPLEDAPIEQVEFIERLQAMYDANQALMPANGREMRNGVVVVEAKDADGLGGLIEDDFIHYTWSELELPGPKHMDNVFDPGEYLALAQFYRRQHGAPPDLVQEMLAGKVHPVVLGV